MNDSTISAAVARLRDKATQLPPNILAEHRPPLLSFAEFIARSQDRQLPESVRMANRQLAEQIRRDDKIDFCYAEIPISIDPDEKQEGINEVAGTIADFTLKGDVLVVAICVMPD